MSEETSYAFEWCRQCCSRARPRYASHAHRERRALFLRSAVLPRSSQRGFSSVCPSSRRPPHEENNMVPSPLPPMGSPWRAARSSTALSLAAFCVIPMRNSPLERTSVANSTTVFGALQSEPDLPPLALDLRFRSRRSGSGRCDAASARATVKERGDGRTAHTYIYIQS